MFGVLLAAAVAGWALLRVGSGGGSKPPPVAATSVLPSPTASESFPVGPFDVNGSARDQLLSYVFAVAHDPDPAQDIIRTGGSNYACSVPSPQRSPRDVVRAVVHTAFPVYAVVDIARVIDRFAGLCVLGLRAEDAKGTILIVRVTAPVADATIVSPRLDEGAAVADETATQFVRVSTRDGWVITVGTSGPPSDAPDQDELTYLAEEQSLRW